MNKKLKTVLSLKSELRQLFNLTTIQKKKNLNFDRQTNVVKTSIHGDDAYEDD